MSETLTEASHDQDLYLKKQPWSVRKCSSEIQQLRQERDHLKGHGRKFGGRDASTSERGSISCSASSARNSVEWNA